MHKKTYLMTIEGLEQLKQELEHLESTKRPHAKQRIKHARSFCDFQQESEYETAVKELENIEERVLKVKYMIQQAEIIKKTKVNEVGLGSTVSFKEIPNGDIETYTIVGIEEADLLVGKISINSPVAKSLLGTTVNDEVTVKTPSGNSQVKIVNIS